MDLILSKVHYILNMVYAKPIEFLFIQEYIFEQAQKTKKSSTYLAASTKGTILLCVIHVPSHPIPNKYNDYIFCIMFACVVSIKGSGTLNNYC